MERTLNVLLIEDSEDDATLIVHELERGGFKVEHDRVDTRGEVKEALRGRHWDVILSDHAMPGTCSLEALTIAKDLGIETPFIIVSGWMTDELAQAAVREGARGFVPKNRLERLVPMVKKELSAKRSSKRTPAKKKKSR